MNVSSSKKCLHDCEADLSAAFREVIAAIAGGCVNCAARREAIPEVMRDQRVLRTLRPVLITSPEDQTACPEPWASRTRARNASPRAASRCGRAVVGDSDGEKGSPDCTAATSTETGRFGELRRPPPVEPAGLI